ncbi:MAG: CBS domain-containing protein [Candidatus Diapherotrites archaeon]|uniref:CBS domain-containing protein n=1 Tax=Candidatus Iainarchaeum sp. TaxID=3101447 RepID=A0A8T3YNY6_9ARCH|nr:CBS domain-containing protein [Candidatus Diapherotrites archaeon]
MKVSDCTLLKPLQCGSDEPAVKVAKILRDNKQRRIIVVDRKGSPVGIISTTDMNNRVVAENKQPSSLKAKDVMTSPIYLACGIKENLDEIFKKMIKHESYFCPVTKDGKLYGVLTYGELMNKVRGADAKRKG